MSNRFCAIFAGALLSLIASPAFAMFSLINDGETTVIDSPSGSLFFVVRNENCGTPGNEFGPCVPAPGDPSNVRLVDGGSVDGIRTNDTSTAEIEGGTANSIVAFDQSSIVVTGGTMANLQASTSSTVVMRGGTVTSRAQAQDTAALEIHGGVISGDVFNSSSSTPIRIYGGDIAGPLIASGGPITVIGSDFALDGSPVDFGTVCADSGDSGSTLSGTLASGEALEVELTCNSAAVIVLEAAPAVPALGPFSAFVLTVLFAGRLYLRRALP